MDIRKTADFVFNGLIGYWLPPLVVVALIVAILWIAAKIGG